MRKTLLLVLLAAALGAYVWFYEIEGEEQRNEQKAKEEKLISIPKDSINTIIINDFEKTFRFEKKKDGWAIVQPVKTDADQSAVTSFLTSLTGAKKSRSFTVKPQDKGQFGLRNANIKVKVVGNNGVADSVQLGDKTSIDENMYISKAGNDTTVSITPISLKNNAQKTLFSWRDKKALHFNKDQVRSFVLKSGKNEYSFVKEGSNWKMTKPLETKADNGTVSAVINKLDYGQIKSVEAENATDLKNYKLKNPEYKIEILSGAEQAKSTVSFSAIDNNKAYGKDEVRPQIFTVDSNFIKPFKKNLFDFRDKDLVDFNTTSINRVNLLNDNDLLMFSKDTSDRWQISDNEPIKNYKIKDLVSAVHNLKVDAFISDNPKNLMTYGLKNPKKKLELYAGDNKEAELDFGNEKAGQIYVRVIKTGQVVAIKNDKLKNVLLTKNDVLDETAKKADNSKKANTNMKN